MGTRTRESRSSCIRDVRKHRGDRPALQNEIPPLRPQATGLAAGPSYRAESAVSAYAGGVIEMSRADFEALVSEALDLVPPELAALLDNVAIFVEDDAPTSDPHLLGLYEGIPLTERGQYYGGVLPDRITIYRNPNLGICDTI